MFAFHDAMILLENVNDNMLLYSFLLAVIFGVVTVFLRTRNLAPLPPGPRGRYPFVGMTFDMPKTRPWRRLAEWSKYEIAGTA